MLESNEDGNLEFEERIFMAKKKQRVLTPAELKRKEVAEKISSQMMQEGYRKRELIIGVWQANLLAIVGMLPFMVLAWVLFWAFHNTPFMDFLDSILKCLFFLAAIILLIVVHEGIHGLTWGCFARNHFQSISFGVIWEALTPYCTCVEPLTKMQYITGSVMPTLVLGSGLTTASIFRDNYLLLALAELMILSGGGDFLVVLKILRNKPEGRTAIYLDHPYECGVIMFEK